jgi:hypothetical protein
MGKKDVSIKKEDEMESKHHHRIHHHPSSPIIHHPQEDRQEDHQSERVVCRHLNKGSLLTRTNNKEPGRTIGTRSIDDNHQSINQIIIAVSKPQRPFLASLK